MFVACSLLSFTFKICGRPVASDLVGLRWDLNALLLYEEADMLNTTLTVNVLVFMSISYSNSGFKSQPLYIAPIE